MNLTTLLLNNIPFHYVVFAGFIAIFVLVFPYSSCGYNSGIGITTGITAIMLILAGALYANLLQEGFKSSAPVQVTASNVGVGDGSPDAEQTTTLKQVLDADYQPSDWRNPFGNALLPEIKYNTDRKSAPPSFNLDTSEDITRNVKRAIQKLNPGIKNTNKQLFGDLYNNFMLDNANRVFYSMPSTRIENDQSAFAQFLYHDLVYSGKESTPEGAMARVQDNYRYTLY